MKTARSIVASFLAACIVHYSAWPAMAFAQAGPQPLNKSTVVSLNAAQLAAQRARALPAGSATDRLPGDAGSTPLPADERLGSGDAILPVISPTVQEPLPESTPDEKPTASGSLDLMSAELTESPAGEGLGAHYTGEKRLRTQDAVVAGIGDIVPWPANISPKGGQGARPPAWTAPTHSDDAQVGKPSKNSAGKRTQEVPSPVKPPVENPQQASIGIVIAIVAAVAAVGTGIYLWLRGKSKNDAWENSKSNQDVIALEKARRDNDPAPLGAIKTEARGRQKRMDERVAYAQSAGKKEIELSDGKSISVKEGRTFAAFDGLVAARAELNENAVSKDAAQRVGGELPSTWQQSLSGLENAAKSSEFEGELAVSLKSLRAELGRQDAALAQYEKDVARFDETVPGLFGGRLKEMTKRGQSDIAEFKSSEIAPEKAAFEKFNGAMRGRVSDRLAGRDAEYQTHVARLRDLAAAADGALKSAVEIAQGADKDMAEMAGHERARAMNLMLAAQNENVEVVDYDSQGHRIGSHYEDHSATFKALAASEGAAARASAASAQAQIKALSTIIPLLHKDPVLKAENLTFALPTQSNTRVGGQGGSVFFDFWMPASWNFFMTMFTESQALQARAAFAPVKGALESVLSELNARRKGEVAWTDKQIDKVLDGQMAKAPAEKR